MQAGKPVKPHGEQPPIASTDAGWRHHLQRSVRSRFSTTKRAPHSNATAADLSRRPMRLFVAARSRFSEDSLAACIARGVRQVVVLGAGLDTFSLRNPYAGQGVRVFEVEPSGHEGLEAGTFEAGGSRDPIFADFCALDFERRKSCGCLAAAGLRKPPAFFQWSGVVPY